MGRGATTTGTATATTRGEVDLSLMETAERKVAALVGVKVMAQGRLVSEESGHPAGTAYVIIQADSVDEAQMAADDLAEFARIPQVDWHGTWQSRKLGRSYVLERKIFPDPSQI